MRLNYLNGEGWRAVSGLAEFTANCSPDQVLLELVKLRASQVNDCANCVNLHANRLREAGRARNVYRISSYGGKPIALTSEKRRRSPGRDL